ncbi:MAG: thioredoxin family protein [Phycisphaerae bacterium]|nr:thioredoxin family protein [Phycisphaerae bacterium]
MKWQTKILTVVALAIAVIVVLSRKGGNCCSTSCSSDSTTCPDGSSVTSQPVSASQPAPAGKPAGPLPRLVDLGADRCIPCKRMAPVLEQLREEYAGRLEVEFHDVWKNPAVGKNYGIRMIPTQIFISAAGEELYRHEGYISKEDILGWWREFGVTFEP